MKVEWRNVTHIYKIWIYVISYSCYYQIVKSFEVKNDSFIRLLELINILVWYFSKQYDNRKYKKLAYNYYVLVTRREWVVKNVYG